MGRGRVIVLAAALAVIVFGCLAGRADAYLYWSNQNETTVGRVNLDGTGIEKSFITGGASTTGVAVDGHYVYWTNATTNTIGRANLDGTEVDQSFITGALLPYGVAVNGQFIYWSNIFGSIGRANLDGTGVNQSETPGNLGLTQGVAVDGQHLYWASNTENAIGRANLDGSGFENTFITDASGPTGVAVDGQHIYWTNETGTIGRANLDGTDPDPNFITGIDDPSGLAISGQKIYWSDPESASIGSANLDGTGVNPAFLIHVGEPWALATDATLPPSASITAPMSGAIFALGQVADSSFTCSQSSNGPKVASCLDQNGQGTGHLLDTSTLGSHTLTVTATSADGAQGASSAIYTVKAPPSVSVTTPAQGATYGVGRSVPADFTCAEGSNGPGLENCIGTKADGTAIDTSTIGPHTFTVTAHSTDGLTAGTTVDYTVAGLPTASIASPVNGVTFAVGQVVDSSFTCGEGQGGKAITSCLDQNGQGSGTAIRTSAPGPQTLIVTATSVDGLTATATAIYMVAAQPTPTISAPIDGATYLIGQSVPAGFACAEGLGGPGIASCTGPVVDGAAIDTSTIGPHAFTVTATSTDGQTSSQSVTYTVAAAPTVSLTTPRDGASYAVGQVVTADFSCAEGPGGSRIKGCLGTVADGAAIDTSIAGPHHFAVTATSADGLTATAQSTYTVIAAGAAAEPAAASPVLAAAAALSTPPAGPVLTGLRSSHARWRVVGTRAPTSSSGKTSKPAPIGTTYSFSLNGAANVELTFSYEAPGRLSKGRCVSQAKSDTTLRRCARALPAGTTSLDLASGADQITFGGSVSSKRILKPGNYTVTITATNAAGSSKPQALNFTIVG